MSWNRTLVRDLKGKESDLIIVCPWAKRTDSIPAFTHSYGVCAVKCKIWAELL